MFTSFEAIRILGQHQKGVVVVHTMSTSREWPVVADDEDLHLRLGGAMGKASSVGLGIALAQPDRRVFVLDGDGSLLMNLGTLVTIGHAQPANLVHVVFENSVYEVTGGQPIPGAGQVDFAAIAVAAGYPSVHTFAHSKEFEQAAERILNEKGPVLVVLEVTTSHEHSSPARATHLGMPKLMARLATTD